MNPLQRAIIEKAGHDNGFEYVLPGDAQHVALASALHPARVCVAVAGQGFEVGIDTGSATLAQELARVTSTAPLSAALLLSAQGRSGFAIAQLEPAARTQASMPVEIDAGLGG